jgi:hypothetical protein
MNARRGFLRLWTVASALWFVGVGVVAFQMPPLLQSAEFVMPDSTSGFFKLDNVFEQYTPAFQAVHSKVEFPNNVTLFVHTSVPKAVVEAQAPDFFKTYSAPRADALTKARFSFWTNALLAAVLPSLGILLLGFLVGWIFNGFARDADA